MDLNSLFSFIGENWSEIGRQTGNHISMALTAVGLSCLVAVPLGVMVAPYQRASALAIGIANIIQTIPSLALFAFAMPLLGIGRRPAVFALFIYGLLPILKNTLLGIQSVDPAVIQAAKGMGMTRWQILFKVEIPLGTAAIMGGIRIAVVTGIGIATIAALISAGGLGTFIYQGIGMLNYPMILTGAIASALLALLADFILGLLERKFSPEREQN